MQAASAVLETCQVGDGAEAAIDVGLNMIGFGRGGVITSDALSLLVTNERLVGRQGKSEPILLRAYAQTLEGGSAN